MAKIMHIQKKRYVDRLLYNHPQNDFNDYELIEEVRKNSLWSGIIYGLFMCMFLYLLAVAVLSL